MLLQQWEIFRKATRLKPLDEVPMAMIIDSPGAPGNQSFGLFSRSGSLVSSQLANNAGISNRHIYPFLVDGIWHGY